MLVAVAKQDLITA